MAIYDYQKPGFDLTKVYKTGTTKTAGRSRVSDVQKQIELGSYAAAYDLLKGCSEEKWTNVKAVLLMRLGKPELAVTLLRRSVWDLGSLTLNEGVSIFVQLNLATAFFMSGNVNGCLDILRYLNPIDNEQFAELLKAIKHWEDSLTTWKWLDWKLCRIEHAKGGIEFIGLPGRFGWEADQSSDEGRSAAAVEVCSGPLGLAC